jgi:hypothetical protein
VLSQIEEPLVPEDPYKGFEELPDGFAFAGIVAADDNHRALHQLFSFVVERLSSPAEAAGAGMISSDSNRRFGQVQRLVRRCFIARIATISCFASSTHAGT